MGGNVVATNWATGEQTPAQKIQVKDIGRQEFIKTFVEIFKVMNKQFKAKFKKPIWANEQILANGFAFNGSTSFIMDPSLSDDEVMKYKPSAGDLDITVPEEIKEDLWKYLNKLEGKEIIKGARYMGSNRETISSIGDQINAVIMVDFKNGQRAYAQVDFEFLPFEDDQPTEWAKFSHSSNFADAKAGVKAVHHKYLIQSIIGGASARDDIVIVTPKSTPEKLTFKKMNGQLPRMLKFSVSRGVRTAYEPMMDPKTNKVLKVDGKQVYKEIPSKDSTYETAVGEIYKLAFRQLVGNEADIKLFESFVGVLTLMKKFMSKQDIQRTHDRYIEMLWGVGSQGLEATNPELDFQVKSAGYSKFIKELKVKDMSSKYVEAYYKNYKIRESFRDYLEELSK